MKRREFVQTAALGVLSTQLSSCSAKRGKTPNIVFILSDDQLKQDVGCYGNDVIRTPNIDKIAKEGVRFTRAYTPTAMCAPSRNALYTGLYPHRNGCHMNHGPTKPDVKTLPAYLSELGYRVGLAGKTHIKPKEVFPFEYMKGDMASIEEFMNKDTSPFCLVFASDEPHAPHKTGGYDPADVLVPPYKVDTPESRQLAADYYTDIDTVDRETGDILDLIDKYKLTENTVVFWASDHGFELFAKWTCYEAGLNVPFLVRWPGKIKPGTVSDAMISFVDFVSTAIDIAGGTPPKDLDGKSFKDVIVGGRKEHHETIYGAHTNQGIWSGETYPIRSVRNDRYKYIRNLYPEGKFTCIPTHGWDYNEEHAGKVFKSWKKKAKTDRFAAERVSKLQKRPAEELYDLEKDPFELNNLAEDSDYSNVLLELSGKLDEWMKVQGDEGLAAELKVVKKESRKN